jgi:hypothetical protein
MHIIAVCECQPFDLVKAAGTGLKLAAEEQEACLNEADHRMGRMPLLWERFEPAFHDSDLAAQQLGRKRALENLNHEFKIASLKGMAEGRFRQVMRQKIHFVIAAARYPLGVAVAPQTVATDAVRMHPYRNAFPAGGSRRVDLWLRRRECRCPAWPSCPGQVLGCCF